MSKLHFIDSNGATRTIEAQDGATVMEAAVQNDVPGILATCGGSCSCATCHVYVEPDWFDRLGPLSIDELDMLDTAHDLQPTSRLSCQIVVSEAIDGLTMRTPARQI